MFNKIKLFIVIIMISFLGNNATAKYEKLAYDFNFKNLDGGILNFSIFEKKVVVVVNVASQCGFTGQYADMQRLWEKYQKKNFVILGVPSNDFGKQEPGTNVEIKNFCESKFGITFPMTEKVSVKGTEAHPFYIWAKENYGISAIPKWNFHKIIINKEGKIEKTFSSMTKPSSKKFIKIIDNLL